MPNRETEAAYCTSRIATSTALALASTDSCARASHVGIADAYKERLAKIMLAVPGPKPTVPV